MVQVLANVITKLFKSMPVIKSVALFSCVKYTVKFEIGGLGLGKTKDDENNKTTA